MGEKEILNITSLKIKFIALYDKKVIFKLNLHDTFAGGMKMATQISPLLNFFILPLPLTNSLMDDRLGNWLFKNLPPYHINIWCTPCPKITFILVKIFILCGSKDLSFENWIILGLEFFANLKQCCDN